jgi:hypothetical protein
MPSIENDDERNVRVTHEATRTQIDNYQHHTDCSKAARSTLYSDDRDTGNDFAYDSTRPCLDNDRWTTSDPLETTRIFLSFVVSCRLVRLDLRHETLTNGLDSFVCNNDGACPAKHENRSCSINATRSRRFLANKRWELLKMYR